MPVPRRFLRTIRRKWRRYGPWLQRCVLALSVALLHLALFNGQTGGRLEPLLLDFWFGLRGELPAPDDIVMISIDEKSYSRLGLDPQGEWPRRLQADLTDRLRSWGAKAVVFDLIFADRGTDQAGDRRFAESLSTMPAAIGRFLGYRTVKGIDGSAQVLTSDMAPQPMFVSGARWVFLTNLFLDRGVVRRFAMEPVEGRPQPSMATVIRDLWPAVTEVPGPSDFINYYGPSGSFRTVSYSDVILGDPAEQALHFRNKLVFVGVCLPVRAGQDEKDRFVTSYAREMMYGVEIHTTVFLNLLRGDWIRRFSPVAESVVLNNLAFLVALLITGLTPMPGLAACIWSAGTWALVSYAAFCGGYFVPGLMLIVVVIPLSFTISAVHYYVTMARFRRRMEAAMRVELKVK